MFFFKEKNLYYYILKLYASPLFTDTFNVKPKMPDNNNIKKLKNKTRKCCR